MPRGLAAGGKNFSRGRPSRRSSEPGNGSDAISGKIRVRGTRCCGTVRGRYFRTPESGARLTADPPFSGPATDPQECVGFIPENDDTVQQRYGSTSCSSSHPGGRNEPGAGLPTGSRAGRRRREVCRRSPDCRDRDVREDGKSGDPFRSSHEFSHGSPGQGPEILRPSFSGGGAGTTRVLSRDLPVPAGKLPAPGPQQENTLLSRTRTVPV